MKQKVMIFWIGIENRDQAEHDNWNNKWRESEWKICYFIKFSKIQRVSEQYF